jgi:hypothetical protein
MPAPGIKNREKREERRDKREETRDKRKRSHFIFKNPETGLVGYKLIASVAPPLAANFTFNYVI